MQHEALSVQAYRDQLQAGLLAEERQPEANIQYVAVTAGTGGMHRTGVVVEVVGSFELAQDSLQPVRGALVDPVPIVGELISGRECEGGTQVGVVPAGAEVFRVKRLRHSKHPEQADLGREKRIYRLEIVLQDIHL